MTIMTITNSYFEYHMNFYLQNANKSVIMHLTLSSKHSCYKYLILNNKFSLPFVYELYIIPLTYFIHCDTENIQCF